MVDFASDAKRKMELDRASKQAHLDNYKITKTLPEQLRDLRLKKLKRQTKKKLPWFTVITIVTTLPFFMFHGPGVQTIEKQESPAMERPVEMVEQKQISKGIAHLKTIIPKDEPLKIKLELGDFKFEQDTTMQNIEILNDRM